MTQRLHLPIHGTANHAVKLLLVLALWGFGHAVSAEQTLFTATYKGKYSGMTIKSTRKLVANSSGYQLVSEIKNSFASIDESSNFKMDNNTLTPQHYFYKRKIMGFKAEETIDFEWAEKLAKYRRKDKEEKNRDYPIEPGVLDPATYQLALQRAFAGGSNEVNVTFVKSSKVKTLQFKKTGQEELKIAGKTYQALRVERVNLDDDKETRLWLVPELHYQIARIEHVEEDGKAYNLYLTGFTADDTALDSFYQSAKP